MKFNRNKTEMRKKTTPKPNTSIVTARLVARHDNEFVIAQRKGGSQNGLWEFPGGQLDPEDFRSAASQKLSVFAVAACREFGEEIGCKVAPSSVGAFVTYSRGIHPDGVEYTAHAALADLSVRRPLDAFCRKEVLQVALASLEEIQDLMMWGQFRLDMISIPARLGLVASDSMLRIA